MYEYYFDTGEETVAPGTTTVVSAPATFDTITANRYNVHGPDAYISGTEDAKGLVVTAGGSNAAIAVAPNGAVTIRDLNVTGSISIDGQATAPDGGTLAPTIGPTIMLAFGYQDIAVGNHFQANREPGEEGYGGVTFYGGGFLPFNTSGETLNWNKARLIFRGRSRMGTAPTGGSGWATMRLVLFKEPWTIEPLPDLKVWCNNAGYGYTTCVTPWFTTNNFNEGFTLRIKVISTPSGNEYRFGPVYIQFSA